MLNRHTEPFAIDQAEAKEATGNDDSHQESGSTEANVVLRGGPPSLHGCERYVANTDDKLKLLQGNCYEHFAPTTGIERRSGRDLRVFVWMARTYVAE
ncbi:MAG TPA: DUF5988 family protein [Streptosporangiaceae bacterium]